jgi:tetratricopeptide (TPR) repeat protein
MPDVKNRLPPEMTESADGETGRKPLDGPPLDIPIMKAPPRVRTPPLTWLRRFVVWGATIGVCIWAVVAGGRVLFPHKNNPVKPFPTYSPAKQAAAQAAAEDEFAKPRALFNAGETLLRSGDLSGLETLDQVVKSFPESPQARKAMLVMAATLRYQKNDPEKALEHYVEFIKQFPDDPQVSNVVRYMRELYGELNQTDLSDRYVRDAMSKVEKDPHATERLQKLLDKR